VHYQKLHNLYRPKSVARVVKCRRLQQLDIGLYRNKKLIRNLVGKPFRKEANWKNEKEMGR
jgi:hypothetical protein